MTKKRSIEELLREEAQKSPDPETEATQEADLAQPLELDPTRAGTQPLDETTAESSSSAPATALSAKRTGQTKAELETTVIELREALQAVNGKENSLQQQIANLQSDLKEQKILVQKLQAALEQNDKLKAELEQAKKVILQLSEANSKTPQKAITPKKENKVTSPQKLGLKKLPDHSIQHNSIQPTSPSGETFEKNVGWFD